ncbi:hypothetical protein [Henriciella litoralis]|uniref:hypothetical protein n=1 Tax=Henriciella litoralis TaxID=568102 RepID=UPI0009FC1714|nr:hypothetical protein [Henriciella litoralis]
MKIALVSLFALATAPAALAATIDVNYSPEFQEKLQDDYGVKEGDRLADDIRGDIERELKKANVDADRVAVTILDATPNRPTMKQLSDRPGLDMLRSKSLGGMDLKGTVFDASGTPVAELEYDWYETSIENVVTASVWSDANRASSKFARKLAEELTD